jgi:hypothetical protein
MSSSQQLASSPTPPSRVAASSACRLDVSLGTAMRMRARRVARAPTWAAPRRSSFLPPQPSGSWGCVWVRFLGGLRAADQPNIQSKPTEPTDTNQPNRPNQSTHLRVIRHYGDRPRRVGADQVELAAVWQKLAGGGVGGVGVAAQQLQLAAGLPGEVCG